MLKIQFNLNDTVKKNFDKVDHVFLFDNDESDLLFWVMMKHPTIKGNFPKEVGMVTLECGTTAQISIYEMPNGKFCAVCYPTAVVVDYSKFGESIHKLFHFVNDWDSNGYSFYLYCIGNGYISNLKEK